MTATMRMIPCFLVFVFFNGGNLFGQLQYTRHFTDLLEACDASFVMPVEGWYKLKMLKRSEARKYDLVIESEEREFEIRFKLMPNYELAVPHITCASMVSNMAHNEEHFDIHLNILSADQALADFNADWAAYADFVPKSSLTDKYFGRMVMLHRDQFLLQTIMFFNRHDQEKDIRLHSLRFNLANDFQPNE